MIPYPNYPKAGELARQSGRRRSRSRFAGLALLVSAGLIQACSQPAPGRVLPSAPIPSAGVSVQNQARSQPGDALRVVVRFRNVGSGRDAAALADLSRQAQAPVSYVTSVSADTHVYRIEPAAGQRADELLARLRTVPGVTFVEIDRTARPL